MPTNYNPYAKPKKWRSKKYREFISERPCLYCGQPGPNDPHHFGPDSGMATKASDTYLVPLCRPCHIRCHAGKYLWGSIELRSAQLELMAEFLAQNK